MEPSPVFPMILLVSARILLPLLITLGAAYLYEKLAARWEGRKYGTEDFAPVPVLENCPLRTRVQTAQAYWPNSPCWLALELVEGHVPDACLKCQRFKEAGDHRREVLRANHKEM